MRPEPSAPANASLMLLFLASLGATLRATIEVLGYLPCA